MIESTEGIILITRKFGDSSKIATAYTEKFGKLSFLAKGAYKPKSKFGGALEPMNHTELSFYYKPGKDLHILSNAEILSSMSKIAYHPDKLTYGLMLCESVNLTQRNEDINAGLFFALLKAFRWLKDTEDNFFEVFTSFMLNLGTDMGFAPEIATGHLRDETKVAGFSIKDGCVYEHSPNGSERLFMMDVDTLKKLGMLSIGKSGLGFEDREIKQIINFFETYFSYHTESQFRFRTASMLYLR